jgi:uncharacterized protein
MPETTAPKIFVNLPVHDLNRSVEFFTTLGFTFDQRMTDESATCMIVNEEAFVMLLVRDRFKDFIPTEVCDSTTHTESILALSANSKEAVNEFAETALASGGAPANEPTDLGFMYGRSFFDPDGHLWEIFWMDPAALEGQPEAASQAP